MVLVNQVGGNDSLIFDGSSMALGPDGSIIAQAKSFEEDLIFFDSETLSGDIHAQTEAGIPSVYAALVLGTRDYVRKCGFSKVIIALSGGIDSALTAAIAVDALGKENVTGVAMPSQYSSEHSIADAKDLACNLGIRFEIVPISPIFDSYRKALSGVFRGMAGRCCGRKHSIAHPRQYCHGHVKQVWSSGADDGQQIRIGGRLLHALRRHGWRPRCDL